MLLFRSKLEHQLSKQPFLDRVGKTRNCWQLWPNGSVSVSDQTGLGPARLFRNISAPESGTVTSDQNINKATGRGFECWEQVGTGFGYAGDLEQVAIRTMTYLLDFWLFSGTLLAKTASIRKLNWRLSRKLFTGNKIRELFAASRTEIMSKLTPGYNIFTFFLLHLV